jgi:hypothetical protein
MDRFLRRPDLTSDGATVGAARGVEHVLLFPGRSGLGATHFVEEFEGCSRGLSGRIMDFRRLVRQCVDLA